MKKIFAVAALAVLTASNAIAGSFDGKKILFIDSYHSGYAWSDGITRGVESTLKDSGAELKIHRMDTKRNGDEAFKVQAAAKAKALIESFKPDVVIAADDNASKYLIVPNYIGADLPFVFAGVNWDAAPYGFPAKNVTGMVEVNAVGELVSTLQQISGGGDRVGLLTADNDTERKDAANVNKFLGMTFAAESYVKTFADWKAAFSDLQGKVDILFISNKAGIEGWDDAAAAAFVEQNSKIVSGTVYDFMAPFALVSYAKVAEEQGAWAATSALEILGGKSAGDIAIAQNTQGKLIFNARIAGGLNAEIPSDLLEIADSIVE